MRPLRKVRAWFKSRTINTAALLAVLGAVEAHQGFLEHVLTPKMFGFWTIGIAVVMALLRSDTKTAISEKEAE